MQREFNNENKRRRSVTTGFKRAAIKHFEISPGYDLMTQWITIGWLKLSNQYIAESFKYSGIITSIISDYHSNLIKILQNAELPPNTTVESTNEGDEHNDVFVSENYNDDEESNIDVKLTDSVGESTLSSNSNEDDDEMHNNSISKSGESSSSNDDTFESKKLSKQSKSLPITLATPVAAANKSPAESPSFSLKSPVAKKHYKPAPTAQSTPRMKTAVATHFNAGIVRAEFIQDILLPPPTPKDIALKVAKTTSKLKADSAKAPTRKNSSKNKENVSSELVSNDECIKCKGTSFRACDKKGCVNKTCIKCFRIKITQSSIHYCHRDCQRTDV